MVGGIMYKIKVINQEKPKHKLMELPKIPFIVKHNDGSIYIVSYKVNDNNIIMTDTTTGFSYMNTSKEDLISHINSNCYSFVKSELIISEQ
jgi:hypothetical protein